MSIITAESLTHTYSEGTPFEKTAISDINISLERGEVIGVIGHTGSGKSTFVQHLNGLLSPTSGRILFDGEDVFASKAATRELRFKVGLVFQYPEYQLFEETVYKDIAFGPKNMKLSPEETDRRVRRAAEFVGVGEDVFECSPLELSGGQKRRVAIAGVIAMEPEVLVLDEPTAGLDPAGCESILKNIMNYHSATGATILLVTHNMEEIARIADRLVVFHKGHLVMDGTPEQVFSRAAELTDMGLAVPEAAAIALELRKLGVPVSGEVYTIDALFEQLMVLREGDAEC